MKVCPCPASNRRPPEKWPSQTEAQGKSSAVATGGAQIGAPIEQAAPGLSWYCPAAGGGGLEAQSAARLTPQKLKNAAVNKSLGARGHPLTATPSFPSRDMLCVLLSKPCLDPCPSRPLAARAIARGSHDHPSLFQASPARVWLKNKRPAPPLPQDHRVPLGRPSGRGSARSGLGRRRPADGRLPSAGCRSPSLRVHCPEPEGSGLSNRGCYSREAPSSWRSSGPCVLRAAWRRRARWRRRLLRYRRD